MSARFQTKCFQTRRARQLGVTLIELMISLMLGLLVIGGVLGIFLANREANRDTESLARIQESARLAFDVMGSALREIGGNPCGVSPNRIVVSGSTFFDAPAPTLPAGTTHGTLADWSLLGRNGALLGPDDGKEYLPGGTAVAVKYLAGDSIRILSAGAASTAGFAASAAAPVEQITATELVFSNGLQDFGKSGLGERVAAYMLCDYSHGVIGPGATSLTAAAAPFDVNIVTCPATCPDPYQIHTFKTSEGAVDAKPGTVLSRLMGTVWYVGKPDVAGARSGLYVKVVGEDNGMGVAVEIAPDVTGMELEYLLRNDPDAPGADTDDFAGWVALDATYGDAGSVPDDRWDDVVAVRVTLTLTNDSTLAANNPKRFERTLATTINLRNRLSPTLEEGT
ncbi:MAG: prepilin-type N-terminal cleavage/methylation domain-containing protein [Azoarcus sp.]|jgi:type IV pilus assembly protein PilW|nr:prepilin-type N-terminal cleavage/methylation domain-containing protein [Azoarcus sp.]